MSTHAVRKRETRYATPVASIFNRRLNTALNLATEISTRSLQGDTVTLERASMANTSHFGLIGTAMNASADAEEHYSDAMVARLLRLKKEGPVRVFKSAEDLLGWLKRA